MEKIKFLVMDVDGTLTDGKIYMGSTGELFKAFDIKDGCGIKEILPRYEIIPVIITARESVMLENRCKELGIKELHQGCREKLKKLKEVINSYSGKTQYGLKDVAYVGDDFLDLRCMLPIKKAGGFVVCPCNAIKEIKKVADYISNSRSGEGAIREFIEWYTAKIDGRGLEEIKEISVDAFEFIRNFNPSTMADGRYEIGNGVFANVITYITKPLPLSTYETHQKYIDIQYVIFGEEIMITENADSLKDRIRIEYNLERDITLYDYNGGNVSVLEAGDAVVFYPNVAHRGAVAVDRPMKIRKIVIKLPITMLKQSLSCVSASRKGIV